MSQQTALVAPNDAPLPEEFPGGIKVTHQSTSLDDKQYFAVIQINSPFFVSYSLPEAMALFQSGDFAKQVSEDIQVQLERMLKAGPDG